MTKLPNTQVYAPWLRICQLTLIDSHPLFPYPASVSLSPVPREREHVGSYRIQVTVLCSSPRRRSGMIVRDMGDYADRYIPSSGGEHDESEYAKSKRSVPGASTMCSDSEAKNVH